MFNLIVRRLGFLKHIPFAAIGFDAVLRCWTTLFKREISRSLDEIENEVLKWEGVTMVMHKYGGAQYNVEKKEIGHVHGNGLLDVLLSVKQKEALVREGKAEEHHVFKNSGWISFYIRSAADKQNALDLLRMSWEQKRRRS
jgi:hypothetical protein